jgi:hypothetical protein
MGTNALVAWNCSTEQARTIAFAMPILRRASRCQQLCHYLQLSGIPAKPLTVGTAASPVRRFWSTQTHWVVTS